MQQRSNKYIFKRKEYIMAYLHIDNLYKNQEILMFKECYALEKIHGTSAHISWSKGDKETSSLSLFSGGVKHSMFMEVFNLEDLTEKLKKLNIEDLTVYGEAYGYKCQGMSDTYGKDLKFVAFDVKIQGSWLSVPDAEKMVKSLGLEFVHYVKIKATVDEIDMQCYLDSIQAIRNGIGIRKIGDVVFVEQGKKREGVVLRPLIELKKNNGSRIISKHKQKDFQETKTTRDITDTEKLKVIEDAKAIAEEWVTPMRLSHVLDRIVDPNITDMVNIIRFMYEDIKREAKGEIVESKSARKWIGKRTAMMVKEYFKKKLYGGK